MTLKALLALAISAAFTIPAAHADTLSITLTPASSSQVLTFQFDSSDVSYTTPGFDIVYNMTGNTGTGDYNSVLGLFNTAYFQANTGQPYNFGYITQAGGELDYAGAPLYTGSESSPTLLFGTYNVTGVEGQGAATLNFTDLSTAVSPEPSSLLLLGSGLAGAALFLRRRFATQM